MSRNLLTPIKFLFLIFLIFGVYFYKNIYIKSDCFFDDQKFDEKSFFVSINGRSIDVMGWYHGVVERDIANLALADAINKGKQGDCKLAQKNMKLALIKILKQKTESLRVFDKLEQVYQKRPFQLLGVEYSSGQFREEFIDPSTDKDLSLEFISIFKNLCPEQIQEFSDLYLVFPGPEYSFALSKQGQVKIVPIGNDELVKKSLSMYSNKSRLFSQKLDQLTTNGLKAYQQFVKLTKDGKSLPESKIAELTQELQEPEKSMVRKYFEEATNVLKLVGERDSSFADEILKTKFNMAVVIGNFHVSGLRESLLSNCTARAEK